MPDKETRKFAAEQLPKVYTTMAMVSKPGLATFIMKVLFKLKPPSIPMKNFTDDEEAKQWLLQYFITISYFYFIIKKIVVVEQVMKVI